MARRVPVSSADGHKPAGDRQGRLAALRTRLQETAQQIRTAEDWARTLRAAAQLADESWANVLLISSRIPAATVVKGYQAWRAAGRQVNRDETGIEIFAGPHQQVRTRRGDQEGDAQKLGWRDARRVTYVWDLSQTSGQPLSAQPAISPASPNVPPGLWDSLCWLARREGFAVERAPGCPADGAMLWAARRIRIFPGLAPEQAVWALAHQLGHMLLHNTTAVPPGASNGRLSRSPEGRSRLSRLHHLHPSRRPTRARLLQPLHLGRHRSARTAGRSHPGRRRAHYRRRRGNQPLPGTVPGGNE
jgi:DNA primase